MKVLVLFLTIFLSTNLWAGTEGGGGDAVILPDGSVVLADVFLDQDADQPTNRPKQIALNPRLLLQAKIYAQFISAQMNIISKNEIGADNVYDQVGKRESDFSYFVVKDAEELNRFCAQGIGKTYKVDSGESIQKIACTTGTEIYLVGPVFSALNLKEQTLVLLHESLTTLRDDRGGRNFGVVGQFITSLRTWLKIAYEEQQKKYRVLSALELEEIKKCFESFIYLTTHNLNRPLSYFTDWVIHPFGGGIVFNKAQINPLAYLGYSSQIWSQVNLENNTFIIDSSLEGDILIHSGTRIVNSEIYMKRLDIGENSLIRNSTLVNVDLQSGKNLVIERSEIGDTSRHNREVLVMKLGDSAVLKDGVVTQESLLDYAPIGYDLIYPVFQMIKYETPCAKGESDIYECTLQTPKPYTGSSESYIAFNSGGMKVSVSNEVGSVIRNQKEGYGYTFTFLSFDAVVEFCDLPDKEVETKLFTVYKNQFFPVGMNRVRYISPYKSSGLTAPYVRKYLQDKFKEMDYSFKDSYTIYLKIKESH